MSVSDPSTLLSPLVRLGEAAADVVWPGRERCLACGRPMHPWQERVRLGRTPLHSSCGLYRPPTRR